MNVHGKRIVITGGSSGIGYELARQLGAKGARLVLTGRRAETLDKAVATLATLGYEVHAVTGDVTDGDARAHLLHQTITLLGGTDILVNNAGGVRAGRLEDISEDELRAMIEVDLLSPILLTRAFLPELRRSGDGLIVNIASGIAQMGVPFYTGYAAAKGGLARFGEALRRELKGEGVHVVTVFPGATDTPMMATNKADAGMGFALQPVADVVGSIVAGIEADAFEVVRGGEARAAMLDLNRTDPAAVDARFLGLKPALEAAVRDHSAL
ncbi:MAG: SDR family NAD(P)-dependent oxidoreductase [Sphingomonadaceae bacterium]